MSTTDDEKPENLLFRTPERVVNGLKKAAKLRGMAPEDLVKRILQDWLDAQGDAS
jgi:hypothetical protein